MTIWVEKIGASDIIFFLVKRLFHPFTLYYRESTVSHSGRYILNWLRKFNIYKKFIPVKLSLEKKRPDDHTLSYQVYRDLNTILYRYYNEIKLDEREQLKDTISCYLSSILYFKIAFIKAVESEIKFKGEAGQQHIIYLNRHPFNKVVIPFYKEKGILLKQSLNFIPSFKLFLKPFLYAAAILASKLISKEVKTNISKIRPSIFVEYANESIFEFAFWRMNVNKRDFDIVYYLDRSDTFPSKDITDTIEGRGLKWIDAHTFSMFKIVSFNYKIIKDLLHSLISTPFSMPIWYRTFKFEYILWFLIYRTFFEHFKVKIIIQHQETLWRQGAQARAIEDVGGIMIGYHWSNYPYYFNPQILFAQHVFFVWGKMIGDLFRNQSNICKYFLPSGVVILENCKRGSPLLNEFNFIITIFDSSINDAECQTPYTLSQFYLKILVLIENNPSWGAIIKSKNWNLEGLSFLPNGEEIVQRLKSLIERKRAVVLDKTVSPATAASYANLSVCYGLNSAGVIAGIHGYKAIHWDCSGWLKHPFYKDPEQKFIFKTLDELEEAIIKVANGDNTIGDFSKWRQKLNYFDDFKAPERVGKFIQTFMDEVIRTDNAKHSLDFAVKKYVEENKIGEDFFKSEDWWDE